MKVYRKIIAFFCSIAIITSCVVLPASAVGIYDNAATLWDWAGIMYKAWKTANPDTPDSEYPGFNPGGMFGNGPGASRDDYDNYVSDLPGSGYNSDGSIVWYPTISDCSSFRFSARHIVQSEFYTVSDLPVTVTDGDYSKTYFVGSQDSIACTPYGTASTFKPGTPQVYFYFIAPFSGSFRSHASRAVLTTLLPSGIRGETLYEGKLTDYQHCSLGDSFYFKVAMPLNSDGYTSFSCTFYVPVIDVIPDSSLASSYPATSRPTSITGDYGIIGDNGEITKVDSQTIVNETDNSVYNPVTNTRYDMSDWSYDYSTRTYTITTTTDNSITVTYGDEYVTINEGDTIYNVYYIVEGGGSSDPGTCTHSYTSSVTTAPTCEAPGVETFTCSLCGHTYTSRVPAAGHTWVVIQSVQTEYDESGNLVTQGYTIYECTICGEQYKDTEGVGPPIAPGADDPSNPTTIGGLFEQLLSGIGSVVGGIIKGLLSLLTKAVEAISGIGDLFASFVDSVVGLFGGFTDFLGAVFPFLPEEFFTIFCLGMILLVAAAVLRKFLN